MGNALAMIRSGERFSKTVPSGRGVAIMAGIPVMVGGWEFWRGIATPGYIRDQCDQLYGDAQAFQAGFSAEIIRLKTKGEDASQVEAFKAGNVDPMVTQIKTFRDSHQNTLDNLWGSTLDTVNTYRDRMQAVYDRAQQGLEIGNLVQPPQKAQFGDPSLGNLAERGVSAAGKAVSSVWDTVKIVLYAGLVIIGIGLIAYLFMGHNPLARAEVPALPSHHFSFVRKG